AEICRVACHTAPGAESIRWVQEAGPEQENSMKKMWISGGIAALVLLSGAGAYAGYKASIGAPSISSTFAVGVMGAARATPDGNSYAGCSLLNSGTSTLGFCTIAD